MLEDRRDVGPKKHVREKGGFGSRWCSLIQATGVGLRNLEGFFLPDTWRSVRKGWEERF